jgi:acyl transferase domain-containing protein/NADP-dependent 3-hydroxy acid dehydrogenase YdfG
LNSTDPPPATGPLAIVGIGCLFPGAPNFGAFWSQIVRGADAITDVPATHWKPEDYYDPDPKAADRIYACRGGFLEPVPFNPAEFGIAPNNLEATDTAQLLGLVVAREALRDAGYSVMGHETNPGALKLRPLDRNRVSVILGVTGTLEMVIPLGARLGHPVWRRALKEAGVADNVADDVVRRIGDAYVGWQENSFPGLLGNVVAGRIANRFDLGGTNCVVDAACASSLSALHLAALELQTGRADVVLTGGVDTFNDVFMFMCFSKTPALSPTGDARPFDAAADGTVLGEGVGMVVLKRLHDARRDGDRIYAVLRGVGTSSDGRGNAVYAPRAAGQVEALQAAYRVSGVSPATVELVEAHGTGTKLGDATEAEALTEVYRASRRPGTWCAMGSVKSQIGHTKAAAGVAGLIKAAAALYHKVLPPTAKVHEPIEPLRPGQGPLYLNTEARPWPAAQGHPRRAAVSAFGFGGSNFHCVLEEADPVQPAIDWDGRVQILALGADTLETLRSRLAEEQAALLGENWHSFVARAAQSRASWNPSSAHRLTLVAQRDKTDMSRLIERAGSLIDCHTGVRSTQSREGVFYGHGASAGKMAILFPGQGSQYVGMFRDLACRFPAFQEVLAAADRAFTRVPNATRLSACIYPPSVFAADAKAAQRDSLRDTMTAQPALGAVGLGAWRVLQQFGVHAAAAAGHSYGELNALCAAGRIDEKELFSLSILRSSLMAASAGTEPGAMLAVRGSAEAVGALLHDEGIDLTVANKNSPDQVVLSGPESVAAQAEESFRRRGLAVQRLAVANAFHSPRMAAAVEPFQRALEALSLPPGHMSVFANTTGDAYPADAGQARELLAGQLARPVEWLTEVEHLYAAGVRTFVEVGPGRRLSGLAGAILRGREHAAIALDASEGKRDGTFDLACCLAELAALGNEVLLSAWDPEANRPEANPASDRPSLIVPLCGANYVKPRPPESAPPPPPKSVRAAEPIPTPNGTHTLPMNGSSTHSNKPLPAARIETAEPAEAAAVRVNEGALAQALEVTGESLHALQKLQEQTAQLHRQFLEGQEAAQRTVQVLVEQQQRLLQASLGWAPTGPVGLRTAEVRPDPVAVPAPRRPEPSRPREPVAAQPAAPPPHAVSSTPRPEAVLLEVVAEKTGYPAEVLELDMALDADLGIDSIKRVEILSALQERLPGAPAVGPEQLGSLHTLRQVAEFLAGAPANGTLVPALVDNGGPQRPFESATTHEPRKPHPAVERSVLRAVPLDNRAGIAAAPVVAGAEFWVGADDEELSLALVHRLQASGVQARRLKCAEMSGAECPPELGGLVLLAPRGSVHDAFLVDALCALSKTGPALRAAGRRGGAILATVSRLDGAFGLIRIDPLREPVDAGLAGFVKTARHEWPEVQCKAFDVAADLSPLAASEAIHEEMFLLDPGEIGISAAARHTLERVVDALPEAAGADSFAPGEVIVLSGGARGITAEVAVALARVFRPTLILLGRSPEPQVEPDWLAPLSGEAEVKRALGLRANGNASTRLLAEQYRQIAAGREVRHTVSRIESVGGRAVYRSVDVRDVAAVATILAAVRQEFGPVGGLIHGAGVLADARIEDKTDEQFQRVYGTKIVGLRNLLAGLNLQELRALVLFSSSSGRFGRAGQADYAAANEVLNKTAQAYARRLPGCRVVAVNWGPWDGGMVTSGLKKLFEKEGVGLIAPRDGGEYLIDELRAGSGVEVVVLAPSRAPALAASEHPLSVAFERPLTVAEFPVVGDHVLDGRPVVPAALILEWLCHAALHHNPGRRFYGCDGFRIQHGVILDGPAPVVRAGAAKAAQRDGMLVAKVELRGRHAGREVVHARAEVILGDDLPAPPAPFYLGELDA